MKTKISIITPLYKGKKYLPIIHKMLCECSAKIKEKADVEWIISNDYPLETIDMIKSSSSPEIIVLNTDVNRGIQGARVKGLEASSGEYVLFLDQDDWISSDWLYSQFDHIGTADACVCNATMDEIKFYGTVLRPPLDVCITREYNISTNWGFLPGQVLIRKEAIPGLWKTRWLKWNCCDDYYLWLLMYAENCKFVANSDILYNHCSTGANQSSNTFAWYKSTLEMIDVLKEQRVLSDEELNTFIEARQKKIDEYFMDITWGNSKIALLDGLLQLYERNKRLIDCINSLIKENVGIAIYGAGLGRHVGEILLIEGADVECYIDQKADALSINLPVVNRESLPESVGLVINTIIKDESKVDSFIKATYPSIKIIHLRELLSEALKN